jgi:hypothetical protein
MPWGLTRYQQTRQLHFITTSCYQPTPQFQCTEARKIRKFAGTRTTLDAPTCTGTEGGTTPYRSIPQTIRVASSTNGNFVNATLGRQDIIGSLSVADFNGDGRLDIAAASSFAEDVVLLTNNSNGNYMVSSFGAVT